MSKNCPMPSLQLPLPFTAFNGQYQNRQNTNQNQMKNIYPFYIVFQWWKFVRYSHQIFYFLLFLLAFTSTDVISVFSYIFRTSFNIMWKNIFVTNFPFLIDSFKAPTPWLNCQNLISMTKVFCRCSLTVTVKLKNSCQ